MSDAGQYNFISELPFVASTTGDALLASLETQMRARQKLRSAVTKVLIDREVVTGLCTVSFGRGGQTRIVPSFIFPLVYVSKVTPSASNKLMLDCIRTGVIRSKRKYPDGLQFRVSSFLKAKCSRADMITENIRAWQINVLMREMTSEDKALRELADVQRSCWRALESTAKSQFARLPGQLVRIEGDEGLLSVWNEKTSRKELRAVDASQLQEAGVIAEGDPLILYEISYTPGVKISVVAPAVMQPVDEKAIEREEERLRSFETPLPLDKASNPTQ